MPVLCWALTLFGNGSMVDSTKVINLIVVAIPRNSKRASQGVNRERRRNRTCMQGSSDLHANSIRRLYVVCRFSRSCCRCVWPTCYQMDQGARWDLRRLLRRCQISQWDGPTAGSKHQMGRENQMAYLRSSHVRAISPLVVNRRPVILSA